MKNGICLTLLLLSMNTLAMTQDQLGECMLNQNEHTQTLVAIMADEARAGRVTKGAYDKYINVILSSEVKTCREASAVAAENIAQVFKATPVVSNK